jgi:hypothetical protein
MIAFITFLLGNKGIKGGPFILRGKYSLVRRAVLRARECLESLASRGFPAIHFCGPTLPADMREVPVMCAGENIAGLLPSSLGR